MGLIFQIIMILVLLALGILGFWQAAQTPIGLGFLLYLIPILLALIFIPLISYRTYALWRASYLLDRDGFYLRWGLREEIISMDAVSWVRRSSELEISIPRPWFRWPGSLLGVRRLPDGTRIEYLAAKTSQLILIATDENLYAISPANEEEFMLAYQRFAELGSLTPLTPHSSYPANLLRQVWAAPLARYLLLAGFLIAILLLVLVSLNVPSNQTISLGCTRQADPGLFALGKRIVHRFVIYCRSRSYPKSQLIFPPLSAKYPPILLSYPQKSYGYPQKTMAADLIG